MSNRDVPTATTPSQTTAVHAVPQTAPSPPLLDANRTGLPFFQQPGHFKRSWHPELYDAAVGFTVASTDGSTAVQIDGVTGDLTTVGVNGQQFAVQMTHTLPALANVSGWQVKVVTSSTSAVSADGADRAGGADSVDSDGNVAAANAAVIVTRTLPGKVSITATYTANSSVPNAVQCTLSITGLQPTTPFTTPFTSEFLFDPERSAADLAWWAPWDRNSYRTGMAWTNPLNPSDGGKGFWSGSYNYGNILILTDVLCLCVCVCVCFPHFLIFLL